ncbi:hypothetical protein [Oceanobacillus profundus]|uniref:hypothetical protein n=1 Tax=Oceanobacillus profundus TaxID=372463 RepID=UPI00203F6052|nr:hypothetical protein [Oceanobacillus profundus]
MGQVFTKLIDVIVKEQQLLRCPLVRNDSKEVQLTLGVVRFAHTLMHFKGTIREVYRFS